MKKYSNKLAKIVAAILLICIAFVGLLYLNNDIGVPKSRLELDIRTSQKIDADWVVDGNVSDTMAAFISYPEDVIASDKM